MSSTGRLLVPCGRRTAAPGPWKPRARPDRGGRGGAAPGHARLHQAGAAHPGPRVHPHHQPDAGPRHRRRRAVPRDRPRAAELPLRHPRRPGRTSPAWGSPTATSPGSATGSLTIWSSGAALTRSPPWSREHLDAGADQVALTVLNTGGQPGPIELARRGLDFRPTARAPTAGGGWAGRIPMMRPGGPGSATSSAAVTTPSRWRTAATTARRPRRPRRPPRMSPVTPGGVGELGGGWTAGGPVLRHRQAVRGTWATRELAGHGLQVIGVDFSAVQLRRARRLVPAARLIQADMTALQLRPASADAVVSLYALIHVPLADRAGAVSADPGLAPAGRLLPGHRRDPVDGDPAVPRRRHVLGHRCRRPRLTSAGSRPGSRLSGAVISPTGDAAIA